jgi:hypothetical protein
MEKSLGYGEGLKYDRGLDWVGERRGTISRGSSVEKRAGSDDEARAYGVNGGEFGVTAYEFDGEEYVGAWSWRRQL